MKKRAALGVTENPIRLMPNIEMCEHGIPKIAPCSKCNPPEIDKNAEHCEHGYLKYEGSRCPDCEEKEYQKRYELREKDNFRELLEHPEDSLKRFGIPTKYISSSFETFTGNEKLVNDCRAYKNGGLVLYGNTGCGKTHLAVSIMRNRYKINLTELINMEWKRDYGYMTESQIFKPVPDLLLKIRGAFKEGAEESEQQIIDKYSKVPLLVLDDLGSEKTSEYSITTLYIIIDRRDRELMPTIITTNLTPKEIEEKLGARIASRLSGMKNIKINMPDYRKKRG